MSGIDYSRLRSLTARQIVSALIRDGFYYDRQSGSHQQYCREDGRRVTVTFHNPGDTFSPKVLKSMFEKQAKWTRGDLERLKLIA
jgi:predicted RNA binding protein YcfA (HicA-like mRNA interferase family)